MAVQPKDYTTSDVRPNLPENGKRDGKLDYIEDTRGLWVRKNTQTDELEIWFDGNFQACWEGKDNIEGRLTAMLRYAVEIGERKTKRELREFLGAKG